MRSQTQRKFYNYSFSFIIILSVVFLAETKAQNIIYKKDGTQLNVYKLNMVNNVYSYNFMDDSTNVRHFIGINTIDSIRFEDGRTSVFTFSEPVLTVEEESSKIHKNSIGLNVWPLFYSKMNFYYERLFIGNKLGFKNHVLFNVGSDYNPYDYVNRSTEFYFSTGLNYYFLRSYYFTMGIGGSFVIGRFDDYYDPYYGYQSGGKKINQTGIMLNTSFSYIIENRVPISLVLQLPLGFPDLHHPVFLETNIAFNF